MTDPEFIQTIRNSIYERIADADTDENCQVSVPFLMGLVDILDELESELRFNQEIVNNSIHIMQEKQ